MGLVNMPGWIKSATALIKTLAAPWRGRSQPNAPDEIDRGSAAKHLESTVETSVEPGLEITVESRVDAIEVRSERQIGPKTEGPPNQQEIERRRGIVREFFNDFWNSIDDKPGSFAERLNRAEGYINERMAARGEAWQLDSATRKQLGLPPAARL
jgi:hypothetical protein